MYRTLVGRVALVGCFCLMVVMVVGMFIGRTVFAIRDATEYLESHTIRWMEVSNTFNRSSIHAISEALIFARAHEAHDRDEARASLDQARVALDQMKMLADSSGAGSESEHVQLQQQYSAIFDKQKRAVDVLLQPYDPQDEPAIRRVLSDLNDLDPELRQVQQTDAVHATHEVVDATSSISVLAAHVITIRMVGYGLVSLLLLLLLLFLHHQIVRPIKTLARAAENAARGDLDQVLRVTQRDEIGELQRAFAQMVSDLRTTMSALEQRIKERQQAEDALQASEQQYRAVVDNIHEVIFQMDISGALTFLNPAWTAITGFAVDESLGRAFWEFIPPDDRQVYIDMVQRLMQQEDTQFHDEVPCLTRDGSIRWIHVHTQLIRAIGGTTGWFGSLTDVTERKQMETLKHEFISTVSHELRTPLTSIRGSLGLIVGGVAGAVSPQAKAMIEIAYKNSERLVRLINDILDIEKIESGKLVFDMQPHKLIPLVEQAIADNRGYGDQFGVAFVLDATVDDVQVSVDSDRLLQVLTNLLSNAAKFSPADSIVAVTATRIGTGVRIAVTDRGPGIPEIFHDRIFGKFAQADASDSRQKGGTGLGLSISKAIVERCGGQIGFTTEVGIGTTFFVDLPVWQPALSSASTAVSFPGQPRILICEDDSGIDVQRSTSGTLTAEGSGGVQ